MCNVGDLHHGYRVAVFNVSRPILACYLSQHSPVILWGQVKGRFSIKIVNCYCETWDYFDKGNLEVSAVLRGVLTRLFWFPWGFPWLLTLERFFLYDNNLNMKRLVRWHKVLNLYCQTFLI